MSRYNRYPEGMDPKENPCMKSYRGEASSGWNFGELYQKIPNLAADAQNQNQLAQSLCTIVNGLAREHEPSVEWVWLQNMDPRKLGDIERKNRPYFTDAQIRDYFLSKNSTLLDVYVDHKALNNEGKRMKQFYAIYVIYKDPVMHKEKLRSSKRPSKKLPSK